MIDEFIAYFTDKELFDSEHVYQLGSEWYLVPHELFALGKNQPRQPVFVGTFLGKQHGERFAPGVALLELLAPHAAKVEVSDKAAWLFVCGKDVLQPSILSATHAIKLHQRVLVMCKSEVIGIGKVMGSMTEQKTIIKNVFDIGDFLRRERPRTRR